MKIAIIGSGISGLTAAWHLHRHFDIDVFEAADYAGGHTNTFDVRIDDEIWAIDTGFIVFNDRTYPNFMQMLHELDVAYEKSDMGFSAKADKSGLEYCGSSWNALFAQRRNLLNPYFYRMLFDIVRFNRAATRSLSQPETHTTLGEFLRAGRFSQMFVNYYIVPMGAAIWSMEPEMMFEFPARTFIRFFHNHGLLSLNNRPTWFVISGGSRRYVEKLSAEFNDRIRLNRKIIKIQRDRSGVEITEQNGQTHRYDQVVIATHSDQALAMLTDASADEQAVLGAIEYQENTAVLHTDEQMLPRNRRAWAAWNYHIPARANSRATLTYNMNILQNLDSRRQFCVTLNETDSIDKNKILYRTVYHHPVYTAAAIEAQSNWHKISGFNNTHYCGAYWAYGFHEDGVNSALRVCNAILQGAQS